MLDAFSSKVGEFSRKFRHTLNDLAAGKKVPAVVDTGKDVVDQTNVEQFLKK